eukprot:7383486-Prymnesium_polylepis.2
MDCPGPSVARRRMAKLRLLMGTRLSPITMQSPGLSGGDGGGDGDAGEDGGTGGGTGGCGGGIAGKQIFHPGAPM